MDVVYLLFEVSDFTDLYFNQMDGSLDAFSLNCYHHTGGDSGYSQLYIQAGSTVWKILLWLPSDCHVRK